MHEFSKRRNILGSSPISFLFNFPRFMVYWNAEVTTKVFFPFIKSLVADSDVFCPELNSNNQGIVY